MIEGKIKAHIHTLNLWYCHCQHFYGVVINLVYYNNDTADIKYLLYLACEFNIATVSIEVNWSAPSANPSTYLNQHDVWRWMQIWSLYIYTKFEMQLEVTWLEFTHLGSILWTTDTFFYWTICWFFWHEFKKVSRIILNNFKISDLNIFFYAALSCSPYTM